jgi:hypothetical protein
VVGSVVVDTVVVSSVLTDVVGSVDEDDNVVSSDGSVVVGAVVVDSVVVSSVVTDVVGPVDEDDNVV